MRRTLFACALLLCPASLCAVEPKAVLRGPASAQVGIPFYLSTAGTVTDVKPSVEVIKGPDLQIEPKPLSYDASGLPAAVEVTVSEAGVYQFALSAVGVTPGQPATSKYKHAFCTVSVGMPPPPVVVTPLVPPLVVPPPAVVPAPPQPAPPIVPAPSPPIPTAQRVTVPLYACLAYTPGDANDQRLAPMRTDPGLAPALANLQVEWHAWAFNEPDSTGRPVWDGLNLRPYVGSGGPPVLVIYDAGGNVYDALGNVAPRDKAGMAPPETTNAMVAMFRKMRGQ